MKRKMIALALCSLMSSYACCGCNPAGNESKNQQTSSARTSDAATAGIPEDVRAKLQAALDAPPIELPADEWTEETVKDAIYISGEKLKEPLTLRDFGEGLEVRNDETLQFLEGKVVAYIKYHGLDIATCIVNDCTNFEEIYDCTLSYLDFNYTDEENLIETNYPISVNGVSMGTSYQVAEEKLYFMRKEGDISEDGYGHYVFDGEKMRISCFIAKGVIKGITLDFEIE